jgi:octaheme c-type cytochrome (tetrathionate reductase family)
LLTAAAPARDAPRSRHTGGDSEKGEARLNRFLRGAWALAAGALVALAGCQDDEKKCEDFCGTGAACVGGTCVTVASCAPECGEGEVCQGSGTSAECVPLLSSACGAGCADGQVCVTSDGAAACVSVCGAGQAWNSATEQCDATAAYCGPGQSWDPDALACVLSDVHAAYLDKPFPTAYAVTAECVKCHAQQAADVMETLHWTWKGPTPQLFALEDFAATGTALNPGTIGKENLVNNFCVAVPSNEKRCDQCHAGYGGDPDATKPQKSARAYTAADSSVPLEHRVDCLVCHSAPSAGYAKAPADFGRPAATVNLTAAAKAIIKTPTRQNCGACHFYAGGGDNVKLMGSSLKDPSREIDVHMGGGMDCAACHAEPGHHFKGAGIHVPANVARSSCEDCHGPTPHAGKSSLGASIDSHTDAIACQTCHIPTFSRDQFAKMDWDWSTAGDKTKGTNGVVKTRVNDLGEPAEEGVEVTTYDYMKGEFLWQRNVKPAYAWYNGDMVHVTTMDKGAFSLETGLTAADADRITLGMPLGSSGDATAKIYPFKLMRGKQAVFVDGAASFVLTPNVFGPAGFWGVIQSAGYTYDPATREYTAPNAATPVTTPTPIDALWSAILTTGAKKAGQIPADAGTLAKFDGTTGWDWRYTKLYMDLNHEVAPKAQALACGACHGTSPITDWTQLGYTCSNPMSCPKRP